MTILEVHASERFSYMDLKLALAKGYSHIRFASGKRVAIVDVLPLFREWWS